MYYVGCQCLNVMLQPFKEFKDTYVTVSETTAKHDWSLKQIKNKW